MKSFFISLGVILVLGLLALAGLHFFWPQWSPLEGSLASRAALLSTTVKRGPLTEALKVTNAKLTAQESFTLSFPLSGTVTDLFVTEDQLIYDPIPLAKLDTTVLEAEKARALALWHQNEANVARVRSGTRSQELAISNNETLAAKTALTNSKRALVDAVRSAYSAADDAVRTKTDPLFIDPQGDHPETDFTASDSDLEDDIEDERHDLEETLDDWEDDVHSLDTGDNLTKAHTHAGDNLETVQAFLDDLALAISSLSAGGSLSQETLDAWKAAVAEARSGVSSAQSSLTTGFTNYQAAGHGLTITESAYALKQAGSLSQDIDIARFELEGAETAVAVAEKNLAQATLQTPHSHLLVKKIYPKIGERVDISAPVMILDTPELKMQLDIPEEDMRKVVVGSAVTLMLDAFPEGAVSGHIESIEPQEVTKNESVYYRASVALTEQRPEWRSGMGGTALVTVGAATSVLQVPRSAVYKKNGQSVVQILDWRKNPEEQAVTVGIQDDKMVEIKSGLQEDQTIALYPSPLK